MYEAKNRLGNDAMRSITLVLLCLAAMPTSAGTLYKCVDSKGNSAYQETSCPKASKEAGRGYVQPVAASKSNSWVAQKGALAKQQAGQRALIEAQSGPRIVGSQGPSALDIQAANYLAQGRTAPTSKAPRRDSSPAQEVLSAPRPQDQTLRDYQGNTYTQPAGSAFATDSKSGEQCFVNGGFVHCK